MTTSIQMMKQLYLMANVCIFIAFLIHLALFQCPPTLYDNSIVSDSITLTSLSPGQSQYSYIFHQQFNKIPQLTIGVVSFSINMSTSYLPSSFWVNATASSMGIMVGISLGVSSWSVGRITFIASSNNNLLLDLLAGSFSNIASQQYQGNLKFKLNSINSLPSNQPLVIRTFIAGINANSAVTFLSLANSSLLNNQLNIQVLAIINSNLPTQILVALVAFPAQTSNFTAYGGLFSVSTPGIHASDLLQSLSATQNIFYGVNGVSIGSTTSSTSLTANIDNNFILSLDLQGGSSSFQLSYLFLGNPPQVICKACLQNYQGSISSQEGCVVNCPAYSVLVTIGSGQMCRPCPSALNLGYSNGQCVSCGAGTVATGGVCMPATTLSTSFFNLSATSFSSSGTGSSAGQGSLNQSPNKGQTTVPSVSQIIYPAAPTPTASQSTPLSIPLPTISQPSAMTLGSSNAASSISLSLKTVSNQQCPVPNMFWNGNQCTCIVGYILMVNVCIQIFIPPLSVVIPSFLPTQTTNNTQCQAQNQYFNGQICTCMPGYFIINGLCSSCPPNSTWNNQQCICKSGFLLSNGLCYPNANTNTTGQKIVNCPANSINNGLGVCICLQDSYQMVNGTCQSSNCTSTMQWNGTQCVCSKQYPLMSTQGICSARCPPGQLWNNQTCLVVCGLNMQYNVQQLQCVCVPGYAIGQGEQCQQCQANYYISNGYCVTCPIYSSYSSSINICMCQTGYIQKPDGTCSPKCSALQAYNPASGLCVCLTGLANIKGVCSLCPFGSYLQNGMCVSCPANSALSNGQCFCNSGYILDSISRACFPCYSLPNSFFINGMCALCPNKQVYNISTASCSCPIGTIATGSSCVQACQFDQLMDANGNCYYCQSNMMISGGQCVCMTGYVAGPSGCNCRLNCLSNQFIFMGVCGQCPLNMIYMPNLQGCVCPSGYYLSPIDNICQLSPVLPTTSCILGQYYNSTSAGCLSCPKYCTNCTSSSCSQCLTGYQSTGNSCYTVCGDGIIAGTQTCDTGTMIQPGCINCTIVIGYTCTNQPSICTLITPITPPTPTPTNTDSLKLKGSVNINSNNIYITLATNPIFTFQNNQTMQTFIQAKFKNTITPTMYCQQEGSNFGLFDCLLIYPNGVPNSNFNVTFSYNYLNHSASFNLAVSPITPLKTILH